MRIVKVNELSNSEMDIECSVLNRVRGIVIYPISMHKIVVTHAKHSIRLTAFRVRVLFPALRKYLFPIPRKLPQAFSTLTRIDDIFG